MTPRVENYYYVSLFASHSKETFLIFLQVELRRVRRLTTLYLRFLKQKLAHTHSAGHTGADQGYSVGLENKLAKNPIRQAVVLVHLDTTRKNMNEDEIIKGESPHVPPWRMSAVILENFLFFFLENSDLLLSYVVFATLPDSRRLS